jgi:glycosyltransferase involved in cell wall biosynthesis
LDTHNDVHLCIIVGNVNAILTYICDLSEQLTVSIVAPDTKYNRLAAEALSASGVHSFVLSSSALPRKASPRRLAAALTRRLGCIPTPLALLKDPAVRDLIAAVDAIELHHYEYLPLARGIARLNDGALVVANPLDVVTQSRSRWTDAQPSMSGRLRLALLRRQERRLLNHCDLVIYLTQKDCHLVRSMGVTSKTLVLHPTFGTPLPLPSLRPTNTVVFVGMMRRPENSVSIDWFVREVWPLVIQENPSARLRIVGRDPPNEVIALGSDSVEVVGFVDDLSRVYREANVVIAPLLFGAGLKTKVPHAMLHDLPVVATDIGAEGIVDRSGPAIFGTVTSDPSEMSATIVELLADPDRCQEIGHRAHRWVAENMSYRESLARLVAAYRRAS